MYQPASVFDQQMMVRALQLAELGLNTTSPNPRVGCVIVDAQDCVVGEGYHVRAGDGHAEVNALSQAGAASQGATAYVTLEPCSHHGLTPPCCQALIDAGIKRVVYAMEDPNPQVSGRGLDALHGAGIELVGPVEEAAAYALNAGFIKRMKVGLPYTRIKSAMSIDGRTAMCSGESRWVTGPHARQDVQRLRARSCAVVTGVNSVMLDDPSLTVRIEGAERQPLRVIVDSTGRTPAKSLIFDQPGRTVIATCEGAVISSELAARTEDVWYLPAKNGRVSLYHLQRQLAAQGCNEVLVETGAVLAGAFLSAGLVDELVIYMGPKLLGSNARPLFDLPINKMSSALALSITDMRAVGHDWRITAIPDPEG